MEKKRAASGVDKNLKKSRSPHRTNDNSSVLIENIALDVVTSQFSLFNCIQSTICTLYFQKHHFI